jgi:hypothetical protein
MYGGNLLPFVVIHGMRVTQLFAACGFHCHLFFPFEIYSVTAKHVAKNYSLHCQFDLKNIYSFSLVQKQNAEIQSVWFQIPEEVFD